MRIELKGKRFGRLLVLRFIRYTDKSRHSIWLCECDCGKKKEVWSTSLQAGKSKSCGCLRDEINTVHSMSYTPEYDVWVSMKQRCNNENNAGYEHYGGRGIKVCARWANFKEFIADMGRRPSGGYSIERINNNAGYKPSNCKWATMEEQLKNRRPYKKRKLIQAVEQDKNNEEDENS